MQLLITNIQQRTPHDCSSCSVVLYNPFIIKVIHEPVKQGCPCICGNGETWKDFESYTSGVWPEDEEYQTYDLTKTVNTTAFTSLSGCGCGGQRMKSNYDS